MLVYFRIAFDVTLVSDSERKRKGEREKGCLSREQKLNKTCHMLFRYYARSTEGTISFQTLNQTKEIIAGKSWPLPTNCTTFNRFLAASIHSPFQIPPSNS